MKVSQKEDIFVTHHLDADLEGLNDVNVHTHMSKSCTQKNEMFFQHPAFAPHARAYNLHKVFKGAPIPFLQVANTLSHPHPPYTCIPELSSFREEWKSEPPTQSAVGTPMEELEACPAPRMTKQRVSVDSGSVLTGPARLSARGSRHAGPVRSAVTAPSHPSRAAPPPGVTSDLRALAPTV